MPPATRWILAAAIFGGVLVDVLVVGNAFGVNAPIVMAAFLTCAFLLAGLDGIRRTDPVDAWLAPAALVFASLPVVRADDWLVAWDLLIAAALAAGTVACLAGARITRGLVPRVLEAAAGVVAAGSFGSAGLALRPRPERAELEPSDARPGRLAALRHATPVIRGLVIALPVVLLFGALFASADAVFDRLARDLLAWHPDVDFGDLARRGIVVSIVAWGAAGLLALGAGLLPAFLRPASAPPASGPGPARTDTDHDPVPGGPPPAPASAMWGPPGAAAVAAWPPAPAAAARPLRLGTVEAATVLIVVDLLFAVFVILQLAYLFGGRDTLALSGTTYADYARRGFFELVLVALLAGTLVVALDAAAARRSPVLLGASLALLGLTAIVLLSALLRLRLYQEAYGWTELRFVVLVAIGWLAVALAIAATLLVTGRTRWILHGLGIATLATVALVNVVGPQGFVAQRNLDRAIDPSLVPAGGRTGLDARYLEELGDEAVEPIVTSWPRLPIADRMALEPVLRERWRLLDEDPDVAGWPSWNLTRERARALLLQWGAGGSS